MDLQWNLQRYREGTCSYAKRDSFLLKRNLKEELLVENAIEHSVLPYDKFQASVLR